MKKLFTILLLLPAILQAQDKLLFEKKYFIQKNDTMPYRLLLPENFNPAKSYPLVVFLHGAGERGNDNELQLAHGSSLFLADSNRRRFPAIVVFPQCATNSFWSNVQFKMDSGRREFVFQEAGEPTKAMALLQQVVQQVMKDYKVQKKQIYAGGLSMGGMGTLELIRRNPSLYAAAFSICGGANPATAKTISKIPLWFFHGGKDDVVLPKYSVEMADALLKLKAKVKMTLYPEANHNSWDSTFAEPELLPWLFSHKKK